MSAAEMLEAAIAGIRREGRDPIALHGERSVREFATLLRNGARTWTAVADRVAAEPPDLEGAAELLRTRPTFENSRNPEIASFEQDVRIAGDSRAAGLSSPVDTFLLAVGPLRPALYAAQQKAAATLRTAVAEDAEGAALAARAGTLRGKADGARTSWGRGRLTGRADRCDARAAELAARRAERVVAVQEQVAAFAADVTATRRAFHTAFGVDQDAQR